MMRDRLRVVMTTDDRRQTVPSFVHPSSNIGFGAASTSERPADLTAMTCEQSTFAKKGENCIWKRCVQTIRPVSRERGGHAQSRDVETQANCS